MRTALITSILVASLGVFSTAQAEFKTIMCGKGEVSVKTAGTYHCVNNDENLQKQLKTLNNNFDPGFSISPSPSKKEKLTKKELRGFSNGNH